MFTNHSHPIFTQVLLLKKKRGSSVWMLEDHQLITREVRGLWDRIYSGCWTSAPKIQERSPFKVSLEVKCNSTCLTVKTDVRFREKAFQTSAASDKPNHVFTSFDVRRKISHLLNYAQLSHTGSRSWKDKLKWVIVSIRSFSNPFQQQSPWTRKLWLFPHKPKENSCDLYMQYICGDV